MTLGKGTLIFGRACRTEMVKANRVSLLSYRWGRRGRRGTNASAGTFIIYKRAGGVISMDKAREILQPFGPMNKIDFLHPQLQSMLGLPITVVVEFTMFDPARDLNTVRCSLFHNPHIVWSLTLS